MRARRTSAPRALLTIEGELDDISGAGQTRAAHDLCSGIPKSRQFHIDAKGAGHYGIFSAVAGASRCTRGAGLHQRQRRASGRLRNLREAGQSAADNPAVTAPPPRPAAPN